MALETERRLTTDNRPTFKVGKFDVPNQPLYTNRDIASIIGRPPRYGSIESHSAREENPDIQVRISSKGNDKTHFYDRENLIKVLTFIQSRQDSQHRKKPPQPKTQADSHISTTTTEYKSRKARKPQRPSNFNDWSLLDEKILPPTFKDAQTITMPHEILAVNSVKDILSHLSDGTLSQVPQDLRKYLEETLEKNIESTFSPEEMLAHILWSNSPTRLKRFFHTSLRAYLDSLWEAIDGNQKISKDEREIIEICGTLKNKGFDKEKAVDQICTHFGISIPVNRSNLLHPLRGANS